MIHEAPSIEGYTHPRARGYSSYYSRDIFTIEFKYFPTGYMLGYNHFQKIWHLIIIFSAYQWNCNHWKLSAYRLYKIHIQKIHYIVFSEVLPSFTGLNNEHCHTIHWMRKDAIFIAGPQSELSSNKYFSKRLRVLKSNKLEFGFYWTITRTTFPTCRLKWGNFTLKMNRQLSLL